MDLSHSLAYSRYAAMALAAEPGARERLAAGLGAPFDWSPARAELAEVVAAGDAAVLAARLRQLRRRVYLHVMARDLTGRAPLDEVCGEMTTLAETALRAAVDLHHRALAARHGEPRGDESGAAQALIVIGMGKLGGGELNVSSDIDLVFIYPEDGETDGERRIANGEFFDHLGRRVIAALHDATADGYVFRVDMRLRPYGDSGPLSVSFGALEQYLITQGRTWERYAWLKARPLTGNAHAELDAIVAPFVYRKYLDFDAYEGLRDVHRQIREQARRKGHFDIKLGPGGIRECEFSVQALQLVRAGREPALRARGTLAALAALEARGLLPASAAADLREAYAFLRHVEHRLQYRDDQQTQRVPEDGAERAALAEAAGFDGVDAFMAALDLNRARIEDHFAAVLGPVGAPPEDAGLAATLVAVWDEPAAAEAHRELLAAAGYADPGALLAALVAARSSARYAALPALSRQRFDALVPQVLAVASQNPGPSGAQAVFTRLFALLETVARRSAYLALVIEHPALLPRLANLMGASAWAAAYLTRHPLLLDELLDTRIVATEPDWAAWRAELHGQLAAHPGDAERQMDALRHFQQAHTFRMLVRDIAGDVTVERLADHLSALADLVLQATLECCWRHTAGSDAGPPRFAIVGYGKLGGKELGYASDLDLVFLYDVSADDPDADASPQRYARLAQRINTWLTSTTAAGHLYETDLRLRPDGASGLLVSSLAAFRRYQRENAWTWEHQALTRARYCAGDAAIGAAFEAERDAILRLSRDPAKLALDVVAMRRKMHEGHPNPTKLFDVKHDAGGMVDIEFIVQYLVLAHSHRHPELTRNAGNIALLGLAGAAGLVPPALAAEVADAYRELRRAQHAERLTGAPHARVDPAPHAARRAAVDALWVHVFGAPWQGPAADIGRGPARRSA